VLTGAVLAPFFLGLAPAVLGGFFIFSATREEAYLTRGFPGAYPAYRHSTKMLIPFVF
jgi:protein-S-isoprenylcysteine O-methyltransferase Ste14